MNKGENKMKKRKDEDIRIVSVTVPVLFFKNTETDNIVADCPALQITTSGRTLSETQKNFHDAFVLWYETIIKMGTLKNALIELGWKIFKHKQKVQLPKQINFSHRNVPVELIRNFNQDFNIDASLLQ